MTSEVRPELALPPPAREAKFAIMQARSMKRQTAAVVLVLGAVGGCGARTMLLAGAGAADAAAGGGGEGGGSGGDGGGGGDAGAVPCDQIPDNLVQNCSFEEPAVPAGSFSTFGPGSTGIQSWTVGAAAGASDGVDLVTGTFDTVYPVSSGVQSLDLNHDSPGAISQDLTTTPGQRYLLAFSLSGYPVTPECSSVLTKTLQVTAGTAAEGYAFTPDQAASPLGVQSFSRETLTFTAASNVATITFTATSAGCAGPIVDDVSVVPVP